MYNIKNIALRPFFWVNDIWSTLSTYSPYHLVTGLYFTVSPSSCKLLLIINIIPDHRKFLNYLPKFGKTSFYKANKHIPISLCQSSSWCPDLTDLTADKDGSKDDPNWETLVIWYYPEVHHPTKYIHHLFKLSWLGRFY